MTDIEALSSSITGGRQPIEQTLPIRGGGCVKTGSGREGADRFIPRREDR